MSRAGEAMMPATQRSRKSIGTHSNSRKAIDKENATVDLGATSMKSRSKSLGPGGLDALKQGSGNRRASLAAPIKLPRSILKPTVSALPEIPPLKKRGRSNEPVKRSSAESQDEPSGSKIALRTEEEQQAAAREREERERRDARRKSLANRRVSFAAEATLHTFHEVDYNPDATSSTDSTRRASSVAGKSPANNATGYDPSAYQHHNELESTEDVQNKRMHSSGFPPINIQNHDDDTATSIIYSSDSEPADAVEEIITDEEEDSNSDSDDGTMISVVTEDVTGTSVGSDQSDLSAEEHSSTLDEVLRLAAQRAGTHNLGEEGEEEDDIDEDEEVIPSFGWIKKGNQQSASAQPEAPTSDKQDAHHSALSDDGTDMGMDITGAIGGIIQPNDEASPDKNQDEDMSMEVTRVFGGILGQQQGQNGSQPSEEGEDSAPMEEATMELTTAIGGIRSTQRDDTLGSDGVNEDMSMELTTVLGGVLGKQKRQSVGPSRRRTLNQSGDSEDATMDMTTGIGRIMIRPDEDNDGNDDATMGMDMTTAIGGIINNSAGAAAARDLGKRIMVEEGDKPNSPKKAIETAVANGSPKRRSSPSKSTRAAASVEGDDTGSWAFQGKGLRRSVGSSSTVTQEAVPDSRTPSPAKPATPRSRRASPKKATAHSSQRSTRSASKSASRSASPEKVPAPSPGANPATPSPVRAASRRSSVFNTDQESGTRTPSVVLTPQRRLSGLGLDRNGLGSPRVAEIFERRGSLGDTSAEFVPGKRVVSFEDPKRMAEELDRERQSEEEKENDRAILEREADGSGGKDVTFNLREMIDSLSPTRNPLKGRKSLHVGSASGLLGKRPAELDSDEEDEEERDGVKRLKGHQGSPVKNVRLKNPPSKSETTGHLMRSTPSLEYSGSASTPTPASPVKGGQRETPRHQLRFKDVDDDPTTREIDFRERPVKDAAQLEKEAEEGHIHLQDFLNMTSIRFMELTTTKRRHTAAPSSFVNGTLTDGEEDISLERCVVAGACTVPTLELYQHCCRELKKYISEGRRIVREIETDTFEENPPLFREYMTATPEVKALMDNQFKNVKTHARLLSKAMWYEWRMKLQDGLKEGLIKISQGMDSDEKFLQKQQELLASVMPGLVSRYEVLLEESTNLEEAAREIADSDPAQLQATRAELTDLDADIARKKKLIAELRQEFEEAEADVESLSTRKQTCQADIRESDKIREECRGWTSAEISAFKERVDAMEREHGWAVTGISDTTLSMTYKRDIELVFDVASFQPGRPNSRIDLWYIGDKKADGSAATPKTAEKEFFLQCIRDHIRALPQSETAVSEVLRLVAAGWDKARLATSHIHRVNISFPTTVTKTSDSSVAVTVSLMLVPLETRVEVILNLDGRSADHGVEVGITPQTRVVYGEHFNVDKVAEFLATRIGETVGAGEEDWSDIVVELKERLIARGRK